MEEWYFLKNSSDGIKIHLGTKMHFIFTMFSFSVSFLLSLT